MSIITIIQMTDGWTYSVSNREFPKYDSPFMFDDPVEASKAANLHIESLKIYQQVRERFAA